MSVVSLVRHAQASFGADDDGGEHDADSDEPWPLVSCGVTKVLCGSSGLVLSTVNEHAHFEGERRHLITYQ